MEACLLADVFDSERKLRLVAGNSFVLSAVIHILALYILHKAHESHVADKNRYLDNSFEYRTEYAVVLDVGDKADEKGTDQGGADKFYGTIVMLHISPFRLSH